MTKKFKKNPLPTKSISYDDLPNIVKAKQKAKDKYQTPLEYFGE